jgi:hypothetical protein
MRISFNIGSDSGKVNTITFARIKDEAQLKTIKLITKNSKLLFNGLKGVSYPINGAENYTAYDLTIYLPHHDESFNSYGNFEYLFKHDKYSNWKTMIIAKFPELSEQFAVAEKETKNRQELYQSEKELKSYQENERYRFYPIEDRIKSLQHRITQLRQELGSELRDPFGFH